MAATGGSLEAIEWLVKNGAATNVQTRGGDSPLHLAAKGGHSAVIEPLIRAGVDVNAKNNIGYTGISFITQI